MKEKIELVMSADIFTDEIFKAVKAVLINVSKGIVKQEELTDSYIDYISNHYSTVHAQYLIKINKQK